MSDFTCWKCNETYPKRNDEEWNNIKAAEEMQQMIVYFTFGQRHLHPETEEPMKDYWVEIDAKDLDEAREKMFSKYGRWWGLMYTEETMEKKWYPKGCYERF